MSPILIVLLVLITGEPHAKGNIEFDINFNVKSLKYVKNKKLKIKAEHTVY